MPKLIIISDKKPTLAEVQGLVGGYIEFAYVDDNTQIICNEDGKLLGLPINQEATNLWNNKLNKFHNNPNFKNSDYLVGDVVILKDRALLD